MLTEPEPSFFFNDVYVHGLLHIRQRNEKGPLKCILSTPKTKQKNTQLMLKAIKNISRSLAPGIVIGLTLI